MILGYPSELYEKHLGKWNKKEMPVQTRGGIRMLCAWMNYYPTELHDYQYLGEDWDDRRRIKRKISRMVEKLKSLPYLERQSLIHALKKLD